MKASDFEKLIQIQVELVDQILVVEKEIMYYYYLEKEMVTRRQRELHKSILGCKDEQQETEFAIHYIQIKLQQKRELCSHLVKAFQNRSQEYMEN